MNGQPDHATEVERWLREAGEELTIARVLLQDGIPPRAACFHAHLAAEKALKALLIFHQLPFRRLHDLIELAAMLPERDSRRFDEAELRMPNPWTIEGRYPENVGEESSQTLASAVSAAESIVAAANAIAAADDDETPDHT